MNEVFEYASADGSGFEMLAWAGGLGIQSRGGGLFLVHGVDKNTDGALLTKVVSDDLVTYYDDDVIVVAVSEGAPKLELQNAGGCRTYRRNGACGFWTADDEVMVIDPLGENPVKTELRVTYPSSERLRTNRYTLTTDVYSTASKLESFPFSFEGPTYLVAGSARGTPVEVGSDFDDMYLVSVVVPVRGYIVLVPGATYDRAVRRWETRVLPKFVIESDPPYRDMIAYRGSRLLLPFSLPR